MRRAIMVPAVLLTALSQGGCVERLLAIYSDPPGASVYLDGEKAGTTPCEINYTWYGTRVVVLELRGYSLVRQEVVLSPPWWQLIPIDFLTDVVIPYTFRDRLTVTYDLEPAPISPEQVEAVLERAAELRKKATPPPPKE
jgi:hypothetical protein